MKRSLAAVAVAVVAGCGGASPAASTPASATMSPTLVPSPSPTGLSTGSAHFELSGYSTGSYDVTLDMGSIVDGTVPRINPDAFYVAWFQAGSALTIQGKPGFTGQQTTTFHADGSYLQLGVVIPGQHPDLVRELYGDDRLGKCTVTIDELVSGHLRGRFTCDDIGYAPRIVDATGTFEAQIGS
jgi:hypothetical protein